MTPFDWSQMEIFLAVYREGSLTGAAKRLRVDQSTVSRRLVALEESLGRALFSRSKTGAFPTSLAHRWLPLAERAEEAMRQASAIAAAEGEGLEGRVRLALTDALADYVIAPALHELTEQFPNISLVLDSRIEVMDLTRLEADIALRFSRPDTGDVVARKAGTTRFGVFATREYVETHGAHRLDQLDWVSWTREQSYLPERRWLEAHVGAEPRIECSKATTILSVVRAGTGVALLPERFARLFENLAPVPTGSTPLPSVDVWVVRPQIHQGVPHIDVVADWLVATIQRMSDVGSS